MKFQIILIDPPWPENNAMFSRSGSSNHYDLLTADQILALPVKDLGEEDSILFLWSTGRHLPLAFRCIEQWGYNYITMGFVWVKTTIDGRPHNCLGSLTNTCAEFVLYARRGKFYKPAVGDETQMIFARRPGKHSQKPEILQDRIERLYPDMSKIELFARRQRPGWEALGIELDQWDIRESLPEIIRINNHDEWWDGKGQEPGS